MPPIINSEDTGRVTTKTKEVFIECSGHDLNALKQTLNILVYLLIDMGGEAYQMKLIYDKKIITPNLEPETWKISTKYANKILGSNFSPNQIATLLRKSMHHVKKIGKDIVEFEIPAIRTDIWHDIDVVDDIIRAYGINNLKPKFPKVATEGKITIETEIKKIITELMTGIGFQEIFTLALTSNEDQYEKMNLEEQEHIKLGESVEEKISMVRTWLLPETLKSFMNNRNREYPQKLFEVSDVIIPDTTKDVLSKNVTKMSCAIADTNTDYTKIKQVLVYLLEKFGYTPKFEVTKHESFIEGRTAKVIVNNKTIGIIGELHPQVITNWGLEVPIAGFEIEVLK